MPRISFLKNLPPLDVPHGAILMQALLDAGLPVASSCHGDAVCGKCRIEVIEGWENLSAPEGAEDIVSRRLKIKRPFRVSCQARVLGDITIDTSYW